MGHLRWSVTDAGGLEGLRCRSRFWRLAAALCGMMGLTCAPASAQYTRYKMTEIGAGVSGVAQRNIFGAAMNNYGTVVGTFTLLPYEMPLNTYDGFQWYPDSPNGTTGHFYEIEVSRIYDTQPNAINDDGIIAGTAYYDFGGIGGATHPFYFTNKVHADLDSSDYGDYRAINASGVIAGALGLDDNDYTAIETTEAISPNPVTTVLGNLGISTFDVATAINDLGWAAGSATISIGDHSIVNNPFVSFKPGGSVIDLGTLGGALGAAYAIQNAGPGASQAVVVGQADLPPVTLSGNTYFSSHAFMATCKANDPASVRIQDLGLLGGGSRPETYSMAAGINRSGYVVGNSETNSGPQNIHGFITRVSAYPSAATPHLIDLHSLIDEPTLLLSAVAINDSG